jgi:mercuric ion transport protein
MPKALLTGAGGVVAAFLASLCCVGPLLFVSLGAGAGLASTFEPLRPLFGMLMVALLAAGFWAVYGRRWVPAPVPDAPDVDAGNSECTPDMACAVPVRRGRDVAILWSATALALILWTFPTWSLWLL